MQLQYIRDIIHWIRKIDQLSPAEEFGDLLLIILNMDNSYQGTIIVHVCIYFTARFKTRPVYNPAGPIDAAAIVAGRF